MDSGKYILALDQGTTSSRAIVFDRHGEIKGLAQQEFAQIYPHTGWVEHDPVEILGSQLGVIPEALIRAKVQAKDIMAIGITTAGIREINTVNTLPGLLVAAALGFIMPALGMA